MTDDTFQITGYGTSDDRATVQFDYQINGVVYSTEHFLDAYGDTPDVLTTGLQDWVVNVAKPQLVPEQPLVSTDLQALIQES